MEDEGFDDPNDWADIPFEDVAEECDLTYSSVKKWRTKYPVTSMPYFENKF